MTNPELPAWLVWAIGCLGIVLVLFGLLAIRDSYVARAADTQRDANTQRRMDCVIEQAHRLTAVVRVQQQILTARAAVDLDLLNTIELHVRHQHPRQVVAGLDTMRTTTTGLKSGLSTIRVPHLGDCTGD
jgi:hypothetical protein